MPERRWRIRALRALDSTAGRLVALALGARGAVARGGTVDPAGVRRLLVIRPGGLGDAVHLLPLLAALRGRFAHAAIDCLAEGRNAGLLGPPLADRVLLYDRPAELGAAVRGGYDVVVDTEQWYRLSAVVAALTRAPVRCGFATNERARLFTHPVAYDEDGYEARVFLSLFEALAGEAVAFDESAPFLEAPAAEGAWVETALRPLDGRRLAVLAPAAPIRERQWEPARWVEVARRLAHDGLALVLVGGPGDRAVCARVAAGVGAAPLVDLAGRASIVQTAAAIARAAVFVSSDGGLLHVAHALGVPTVGLFGAGIAGKWAPRGPRARTVRHPLPCSPCTRWGYTPPCPYGVECLRQVTVAEVTEAVASVAS